MKHLLLKNLINKILSSDSKNGFNFSCGIYRILDMDGFMKYDKDVGINWHLRFRLIIQELKEEHGLEAEEIEETVS